MNKDLLRLANHLDKIGLIKEADYLDAVVIKYSGKRRDEKERWDRKLYNYKLEGQWVSSDKEVVKILRRIYEERRGDIEGGSPTLRDLTTIERTYVAGIYAGLNRNTADLCELLDNARFTDGTGNAHIREQVLLAINLLSGTGSPVLNACAAKHRLSRAYSPWEAPRQKRHQRSLIELSVEQAECEETGGTWTVTNTETNEGRCEQSTAPE